MAAAILGVSALLQTAALAFELIKLLGVIYLLYLAWSSLREAGALNVSEISARAASVPLSVPGPID